MTRGESYRESASQLRRMAASAVSAPARDVLLEAAADYDAKALAADSARARRPKRLARSARAQLTFEGGI